MTIPRVDNGVVLLLWLLIDVVLLSASLFLYSAKESLAFGTSMTGGGGAAASVSVTTNVVSGIDSVTTLC